jgi:hypothetical protein
MIVQLVDLVPGDQIARCVLSGCMITTLLQERSAFYAPKENIARS